MNLAVGTAASVVVAFHSPPWGPVLFVASFLTIYFRGHLVPGTRTLTDRYVPDNLVRDTDEGRDQRPEPFDDTRTIESFLRRRGALRTADDGELELTPSFRAAHRRRTAAFDSDDGLLDAATEFVFEGAATTESTLGREADAFVLAHGGSPVVRWVSRAAMVGDVAAAAVFAEWTDDWRTLSPGARLRVLGALRLWYGRCPTCGGATSLGRDAVESRHRSVSVLAATCDVCGARVFETDFEESLAPPSDV